MQAGKGQSERACGAGQSGNTERRDTALSGETAPLRLQLQRLGRRTHPVLRGCRKGRCGAGSRGPVTPGSARLQPRPQERRQAKRARRAGLAELGHLGGGCGCGAGAGRRADARADGTRRGGRAGQASAAGMVLAAAGARKLKPERSRHGDAAAASRVSELTGGGRGRCGRAGPAAGRAAGGTQPGWRAGRHRAVCGEGPPPVSGSLGRAEHPRDGDTGCARGRRKRKLQSTDAGAERNSTQLACFSEFLAKFCLRSLHITRNEPSRGCTGHVTSFTWHCRKSYPEITASSVSLAPWAN